jgi:excisionase family DNA binding protein
MAAALRLLSVEEVARSLGVHVRTVRRYLREGRLRGVKIGKQYRIAATDLAALTGGGAEPEVHGLVSCTRHSEASAVVQIDGIGTDGARRVANGVGGALKGRDKSSNTPLRIDTLYDESRARLKLIVTGSLATVIALLRLIEAHEELAE